MQEARQLGLTLEENLAKTESELTESESSLAYVTTKLHATEAGRNELDRKLQDAHSKLKGSDAALVLLKDQVDSQACMPKSLKSKCLCHATERNHLIMTTWKLDSQTFCSGGSYTRDTQMDRHMPENPPRDLLLCRRKRMHRHGITATRL